MRKRSLRQLKNALWRVFSDYIRKRDDYRCISCDKQCVKAECHAGHYIPKSAGLSIFFDEKNTNAQCISCNLFRHGNLPAYALALINKYGPDILKDLDKKRREIKKYTRQEYEEMIERYKKLK